jgi:putative DNA primase/helicase
MNAESLAMALGGRNAGAAWMACCPAHQDRDPSLAITNAKDGNVLVRCHAGCDQRDVIEALRARGLWEPARYQNDRRPRSVARTKADSGAVNRTKAALGVWQTSRPADETSVASYLQSRGIAVAPPPSIRFHAGLRHPSGGVWPAMVALVTSGADGTPLGVHRTFLGRDGNGKAPVDPPKMMLGPCRGGAVRLADPGEVLMVGEGIESCLAAVQATNHAAWAALSTSGLRSLDLPREVRDVIVLADGDDPGEAAAQACAWRWKREGRRVRIARPPRGLDFNDLLRPAPLAEEVVR